MDIKFLDLKKNYCSISDEISNEFNSLFQNCDFINGQKLKTFEENFAKYLGIKHFIGCANGTDALEIAIKVLNLNSDDEIIVQGNTYIATCLGVLNNNINLVVCDINPLTHMIDIQDLKNKITNKTKAIIIVHLYGFMPNMDEIDNICKNNNLILIEDCAQAHGATWKGKKAGSFGKISCFSFYPGKNLGAYGDGGGIGTDDYELNEKIRKIINLGCKIKYYHEIIGRNSRLDTIQASFLNVKLKYLDTWNNLRRKNADIYKDNLSDNNFISLPIYDEYCSPVYHLYVIKTKYRDDLKNYLNEKNISSLIHYPISIPELEAFKNLKFENIDNCIQNSKEILSLPMYPELEETEINYICSQINNFFIEKSLLKMNSIENSEKSGILHFINNLNFETKRIFYIDSFNNHKNSKYGNKRGFHANINFDELIICLNGEVSIKLTQPNLDTEEKKIVKNETVYVKRNSWVEYEILDEKTILIVLANEIYSKSKSIFDFEEFKNN